MKKLILLLLIFFTGVVSAQEKINPRIQKLPIDKNVRYGVLDNGLTYYIRHNELPKNRADFYIAQKVGSILEEEDQRGLAHFLEHMAFNGTKSFPEKTMLTYLESIGVKFGINVNAYTSFDETVYNMSNVPVIREGIVDSCLLVLHDWACAISLENKEIDNERGVIREEWRTRNNANNRIFEQILPEIYPNGNRYGNRMPIGLMSVVDNFEYQAIKDYYHKWYRPDQQGIIVVGDFDAEKMESKVKALFGGIKMPENPAKRVYFEVPDNKETIVAIGSDKEATSAQIIIFYKHDKMSNELKASIEGLREDYVETIAASMLNARLEEITQKPSSPFLGAEFNDGDFFIAKTKKAFTTVSASSPEDLKKSMTAIIRETERARQHGVTASEYERAKANFLSVLESAYAERDKQKNESYVREYVSHFTDGGSISGMESEYKLYKQIASEVTLENINQYIHDRISDENIVIALMTSEKDGVPVPTKEELLNIFNQTRKDVVEQYVDNVSTEPLISKLPKSGKVVKTSTNKTFGATVWTLSNGATVVVKPTNFKDDEIIISATSRGGNSLIPDSEVVNIKTMNSVAPLGGLGSFSATELPKVLAGKNISSKSSVGANSETLSASSSVRDLETMFQLVYLEFTAVRKDETAFQSWKERTEISLENGEANPALTLKDSITSSLYHNNPRMMRVKKDDLEKVDYDKILELYGERFKNAGDFVFTFVGNVNLDTLRPLVEKYIASLPGNGKKENFRDLRIDLPKGEVKNYFNKEMETPKTSVNIWYSGNCKFSTENNIRMSFLTQALRSLFLDTLREEEGGTYGASVSGKIDPDKNDYWLSVNFDTNAEQRDKLISIVHREIEKMAANGPSEKDFNKIKEYMLKSYSESIKENTYWMYVIDLFYLDGKDRMTGYVDMINKQSISTIRDFAKELLTQGNVAEVVMTGTKE